MRPRRQERRPATAYKAGLVADERLRSNISKHAHRDLQLIRYDAANFGHLSRPMQLDDTARAGWFVVYSQSRSASSAKSVRCAWSG